MKIIFCKTPLVWRSPKFVVWVRVNSFPNNKIVDWSKFKTSADDKIHVTENFKFVLGIVENIVGKGENAGYQHFLLFPRCFPKGSSAGSLKVIIMWERVHSV